MRGPALRRPWIAAAIRGCVECPGRAIGAWVLVALLAGLGLLRLDFDTSTGSVLDRSDPAWGFYQDAVARFGGDEIIVVAVWGDEPWDPKALAQVVRITRFAEGLPGVRRVDSLSSFTLIQVTPDGSLRLEPALVGDPPEDPALIAQLAERVEGDRIAPRILVSDDARVFAVNVLLDAHSAAEQAKILEAIRDAIDPQHAWVSGVPVFRTGVNARTRSEILLFVPVTVLAIAGLLLVIFGSVTAAVVCLVSSGAGTLVALGGMGALGIPITISTMILPSILLALGSAYVMHVLAAARGAVTPDCLAHAVLPVATPVLLSGLTTAIGFVALSLIRIDAIRDLGGFGALGVLGVCAASLTLAPALLALRPIGRGPAWLDDLLRQGLRRRIVSATRSAPGSAIATWALLLALASLGLGRLTVETDAVLWFPHGSHVRDSYESIREHLSGISPMNVVIQGSGDPVTRPDVVAAIDGLSAYLESLPDVGRAISVSDPIAQIHAGFTGHPLGELPADRGLIEQYLVLLESVEHLGDVLTPDRSSANVVLRVDNNGSEGLVRVASQAEAWWRKHAPQGFTAQTTGIMFEFARSENEIAWGQLRGLAFAMVAIGAVVLAIFRSPYLAAIAAIPNIVPLGIVFGFMGLLGIPLDAVTVGLGSTALGIAVDDTIHLLNGYCDARAGGRRPLEAVDASLERVLPPLVYTSVAIAGGFGVLALSNFTVTQNLGLVTAFVVTLCLLADLTLLPALLVGLRRREKTMMESPSARAGS